MPKKILLIENDASFAGELSRTLEASGFEPHVSSDGKDALDLARELAPDAIVLCVELPGMSGYLVCQKLKKDEALRAVPLVLTSAEATEETFEKHRTLKARADEYMLKPYEPAALVEKLGALVGLPDGPAEEIPEDEPADDDRDEEVVSLEEEAGLAGGADVETGGDLPGLDLQSLPDEPAAAGGAGVEPDELKLLDEAFDGLSAPSPPEEAADALDLDLGGEKPVGVDDLDAAAASLPEDDEDHAGADLGALDDDADRALGALGGDDESFSLPDEPEPERAPKPVRGASADHLRAAGVRLLDGEAADRGEDREARRPAADGADAGAVRRLEREIGDLRSRADEMSRRAEDAEAQARQAQEELESAREDARRATDETRSADADLAGVRSDLADARAEADDARAELADARAELTDARAELTDARTELADVRAELEDLRARLAEAEHRAAQADEDLRRRTEDADGARESADEASARAEALEREADELRTEILVARGEAEGARGEVEKRTAEMRRRVSDLEAASAKNEERVVKAYQKIKADEKVREKVRKALAIATQLLEDGLPAEPAADKERRPSVAAGRE